jgi:hypothetical protein
MAANADANAARPGRSAAAGATHAAGHYRHRSVGLELYFGQRSEYRTASSCKKTSSSSIQLCVTAGRMWARRAHGALERTAAAPAKTRQRALSGGRTPRRRIRDTVVCPPRQVLHGWCPTSMAPGRKRWPCGQLCGGRVIHEPSVQRTHPPGVEVQRELLSRRLLPPADITKVRHCVGGDNNAAIRGAERKN